MSKPQIPSQKRKYQELNKRLAKYVALVEEIYNSMNLEAAKIVSRTGYNSSIEKKFRFDDYPQTKDAINKLQTQFVNDIGAVIYNGTTDEWKKSNLVQDLIADKVLKAYNVKVRGEKYKVFYQTNSDALKAFQQRKDEGMNVSAKLWNQSINYKEGLEAAISCAIEKGTSAITLSKQISKYLIDFPKLKKDYEKKYGKASDIKDCEYRSIRLARSEINMAYRTAEQKRWQQFDFVVGYEIKVSNVHHDKMPHGDICDELAGKYPKDFVWTGWHPNCMDFCVPILKTEEEFWKWDEEKGNDTGSINEVKDVPDEFKQWIGTNSQRINDAEKRGTLPYFIKDNKKIIDGILTTPLVAKNVIYKISGIEQMSVLDGTNYNLTKAVADSESNIRMNKDFETAVVLDRDGKIIIDKRGGDNYVQFSNNELSKVKDCIFTHNHPGGWKYNDGEMGRIGNSFSIQDISLAVAYDLAEMRAVTPNYTFSMKRPDKGWGISIEDLKDLYNTENRKLRSEFMSRINEGTMTISQAETTHFHVLWKRIAKKLGFEYKKMKTR